MIQRIRKRDGRIVAFDQEKITNAIYRAAVAVGGSDMEAAKKLASKVAATLEENNGHFTPSVEEIQDIVERVLMQEGHVKTAKAYILYRYKRAELRKAKEMMFGVVDDVKLSLNAMKVLEKRYLRKDENGGVAESPAQMFRRVAKNIASADLIYDPEADVSKTEEEFYDMMTKLEFLPNSPTLMNAGTELQQLSACFVLPVEDSMEAIFESIKHTALIHQTGGGTGFSFSRLRPKNDVVKSTGGVASGPISFMNVFDAATDVIKQGGRRRGANMGILRVDHPDIIEFITAKEKNNVLNNFNISVAVTERFMEAAKNDEEYELMNPRTKQLVKRIRAKTVLDLMVAMAWKNGEPGIIFIDRINRDNPTPLLGVIESTNPCGEQPLLPYESCNLGSINLSKMVARINNEAVVDWEKLRTTVRKAVHFLDNVVDISNFPVPKITEMVRSNRKIGLGVMGFADMLVQLGIPYDSEEAVSIAGEIMKFITEEARKKSMKIALQRGSFPNFQGSSWEARGYDAMRNATVTTIAPTGTLSIIAGCSSGIEPLFAISYIRNVMDNTEMLEVNPYFEEAAKREGFFSERLMRSIAGTGSIQGIEEIPERIRRIFVTAHDIPPIWHVRMQAAFQASTDNAVSKTVNFPHDATTQDVQEVFKLSYELGCKGVTLYRDGSREAQVLNISKVNRQENALGKADISNTATTGEAVIVGAEYDGGCTKSSCNL